MSDTQKSDTLVIKVHDSKVYKQYEKVRAIIEALSEPSAELLKELDKLGEEAEAISMHHASFYGLTKQFYKRMINAGLDATGLPKDDETGKVILFKSQIDTIDTLLKLMATLGTYYDKKEGSIND